MNREKKLLYNTFLLSIGAIISKGLGFVLVLLLSRWVDKEEYGSFDLLITYSTLCVPLFTLAITEALFRFMVEKDELKQQKLYLTNGIVCIFSTSAIGILIAAVFIFNYDKSIVLYFLFYLISDIAYNVVLYLLRGLKCTILYTATSPINIIITAIVGTIYILILHKGLDGLLLSYGLGNGFTTLIILFKIRIWKYCDIGVIDFKIIKKMILYSLPLIPNMVSWWILNASSRTLINYFLGSGWNGIYAIANKVPSLCTNLYSVFNISWQESISVSFFDDDRNKFINVTFNQMIRLINSLSCIIVASNFIFFEYFFSQQYYAGRYYVPLLMVGVILNVLSQFWGGIFIATKDTKWNGGTTVVAAIISVIINLSLLSHIGVFAASLSNCVAFLTVLIIRAIVVKKKYRISISLTKRTMISFGAVFYFIFVSYLDNILFNFMNLVLAISFCYIENRKKIKSLIRKSNNVFKA